MVASYYTRSKVPRTSELVPSECSDVKPSDDAPLASTSSPPPSIFAGPYVEAVEGPELVSAELAGPVCSPTHPLPVCQGLWVFLKWGSLPWGTPAVLQARLIVAYMATDTCQLA